MLKLEEQMELLKKHEELKEMPARLNFSESNAKDLIEYYNAFNKHIQDVVDYICKDSDQVLNYDIYKQDFWWVHNSKTPLRYSTVRRISSDPNLVMFSDIYLELLLQCLHSIIETGEVTCIVYADIQHGEFVAYKVYEKLNNTWNGISYTKSPRI